MPVDASIYANAVPQQPNPLAIAGGVASLQNAQNQNRLFSQEFGANKAYGGIIQQATDPTTGVTDFAKANALASQDPATAFKAPQYAQQALEREQAQTTLQKSQLDVAHQQMQTVYDQMGALAGNPNLTPKDFIAAGGNLIAMKVSDPAHVVQALQNMPQNATPQQLQAYAKQLQLQALDGQQRIQAMYGSPMTINTGGEQRIVAASPMMGTTTPISPVISNSQDPATRGQRVTTMVGGVPGSVPLSSLEDPQGNALGAQPAASGGSPLGTGRYPAQGAPAAPGGPAASAPAGFVPSGPKLGAGSAADVAATASANQGVDLQKAADMIPQQKALLGNLDAALDQFTSGPGADWKKFSKSFVNSNSPFGNIFDPKSIASQEEFTKQATQLVQSQFQALGGTGTDAKLDSASKTSPNDFLSPMGNKGIINMLKGNADAISVKNGEWQTYLQNGGSPQDYGAFSKQFNKQYDPRVFQSVYMAPDQRQDLLKGLDKSEKSQFQQSYNYAVERGWIPDPRKQNAAQ